MAYAQIAQEIFSFSREDGTVRNIQFTFEQADVSAQSYDIPLEPEQGIIVQHGDQSDSPTKPVKIDQARFTLTGDRNQGLIAAILAVETREIRVTIEDTNTAYEYFKGYVTKGLETKRLYDNLIRITVRCADAFADLDRVYTPDLLASTGYLTFDDLADEIGNAIDIDRPLDMYTSIYHTGQAETSSIPTWVRFPIPEASGALNGEGSLLSILKSTMLAFGLQCCVDDGRLSFASFKDRSDNPSGIRWHIDGGSGNYSASTRDIEINLSPSEGLEDARSPELSDVGKYRLIYSLFTRDKVTWTDPADPNLTESSNNTINEYTPDTGLVSAGDTINVFAQGRLHSETSGVTLCEGNYDYLGFYVDDLKSGDKWWYNADDETWEQGVEYKWNKTFFFNSNDQEDAWSIDLLTSEIPDGIVGTLTMVWDTDINFTSGDMTQIQYHELEDIVVVVPNSQAGDLEGEFQYVYEATPTGDPIGEIIEETTFIGEQISFTKQQAVEYTDDGTSWQIADDWQNIFGAGSLGTGSAGDVGDYILGSGDAFEFVHRDTIANPSLLYVYSITNNNSETFQAFPIMIKKDLYSGFIKVYAREVFDQVFQVSRFYEF